MQKCVSITKLSSSHLLTSVQSAEGVSLSLLNNHHRHLMGIALPDLGELLTSLYD